MIENTNENKQQFDYKVPDNIEQRLDVFCCSLSEDYSREYIKRLLNRKLIHVNGSIKKASYKVNPGEIVSLVIPKPKPSKITSEKIDLEIIFEDKDILVVNKPQGMVVHPAPGNSSGTLVNALMYHTQALSTINGVMRPGIVHRIDKDTSGLLMVAKNDLAHKSLSEQLKEHTTLRQYYGLVKGNGLPNKGTVNMPIGRDPRDRIKMAVVEKNSKEAITHFEVLERYRDYTLLRFQLETGRTHQIRVHMTNIGHPLAGDPVYGKGNKNNRFATNGQCLHAQTLGFVHPRTGENLLFEAPLPELFQTILKTIK
jgi:23S rRNA pseudouridine1911/1915/1917 synthase